MTPNHKPFTKELIMFRTILFVSIFSALLQGCASVSATKIGSRSFGPKMPSCEIQVFTTIPTDKKFEEACLINARGGQSIFEDKDASSLIAKMKIKACECGADAIIIRESKDGGYNFAGPADRATASATAIVFVANK